MTEAAAALDARQKERAIEQHSVQAGQFARSYEAQADETYRSCFAYSRKQLDRWLDSLLPSVGTGKRLLDVGCGTGHHMARMRARGFDASGVDGSPEMLAFARQNNPGSDIRPSDVDTLPFADASFDVVMSIEVLRYVPDPHGAIREMARVLRPGGIALVTAAPRLNLNGYWPINRLATALPLGNLVRLKQFFTSSGRLRQQFRGAGFGSVDVHGVYLGPINWVQRLLPFALSPVLRTWEPLDRRVADAPILREMSNMYLVHARRA